MFPAFLDWEVNDQLLKVKADIGEASKNPQDLLLEAIHSAGFSGALANPLLASESAINGLNGTILEEFVVENYTAPRIVLAASGVEHEDLLSIAEPLLCDLPSGPYPEESKLVYTSGDYRCQTESGVCTNKNEVLCFYSHPYFFCSFSDKIFVKSNTLWMAKEPILLLHLNFLVAGIT